MISTTSALQNPTPTNLFWGGFYSLDAVGQYDTPVQLNAKTMQMMQFFEENFKPVAKINAGVTSLDLARLYTQATGIEAGSGEIVFALIKLGYRYERQNNLALFNLCPDSFLAAKDKFLIQFITELPKAYLSFRGPKTFNSLTLRQRSEVIKDYLKRHFWPKAFVISWMLNKSNNMGIRFLMDERNTVIEAEAFPYQVAVTMVKITETQIETPEAKAF